MNVRIEPSWNRVLAAEWEAPYFKMLTDFVRQEYDAPGVSAWKADIRGI